MFTSQEAPLHGPSSSLGPPRTPAEATLASLLKACGRGDAGALSDLYDVTAGTVYRLSLMVLGDEQRAEANTHGTYATVWEQAARYDSARQGNALSWLVTIAYTQARGRTA